LLRNSVQVIIETKLIEDPYPGGNREIMISGKRPKAEEEKTA
jgi:hypothetical protein